MWSQKILARFDDKLLLPHLASMTAIKARNCLLTSTNWDGTPMVTQKKTGKPLIDTGAMLRSITSNDNEVSVNVPYAQEVQDRTGNRFIDRPTPEDFDYWLKDF